MSMMQVTGRHPLLPSVPCHSATMSMMHVTGRHPLLPSPSCSGSSRHSPAVAGMRSDSDGEDSLETKKKGGWFEDKHKLGLSVGWFIDRASSLLHKGSVKSVKGLWDVCDSCGSMLYTRSEGLGKRICQECGHHLRMGSTDRIELLLDPGTWHPLDEDMVAQDVLKFRDEDEYGNRITVSQKMSGLTDAVQTGLGEIQGTPVALGVMDFRFMGGSMGSVVGEKITRLVEHATQLGRPLVIVCSSGGARMQEGTLSLMQMAKVSAALEVHQVQNGLLYIPILTNPTTGGVTASFGMLGDIIIAEPKAYIAFAGGRVINQTLGKKLPEGFQVAEYVFEHGLIDLIVPGNLLRSCLSEIFQLYAAAPSKELSRSF